MCCREDRTDGRRRLYIMTLGCLAPYRRLGIGQFIHLRALRVPLLPRMTFNLSHSITCARLSRAQFFVCTAAGLPGDCTAGREVVWLMSRWLSRRGYIKTRTDASLFLLHPTNCLSAASHASPGTCWGGGRKQWQIWNYTNSYYTRFCCFVTNS